MCLIDYGYKGRKISEKKHKIYMYTSLSVNNTGPAVSVALRVLLCGDVSG